MLEHILSNLFLVEFLWQTEIDNCATTCKSIYNVCTRECNKLIRRREIDLAKDVEKYKSIRKNLLKRLDVAYHFVLQDALICKNYENALDLIQNKGAYLSSDAWQDVNLFKNLCSDLNTEKEENDKIDCIRLLILIEPSMLTCINTTCSVLLLNFFALDNSPNIAGTYNLFNFFKFLLYHTDLIILFHTANIASNTLLSLSIDDASTIRDMQIQILSLLRQKNHFDREILIESSLQSLRYDLLIRYFRNNNNENITYRRMSAKDNFLRIKGARKMLKALFKNSPNFTRWFIGKELYGYWVLLEQREYKLIKLIHNAVPHLVRNIKNWNEETPYQVVLRQQGSNANIVKFLNEQ